MLKGYYPHIITLLLLGGFAATGMAAGTRYAIGIIGMHCSPAVIGPTPDCIQTIKHLNWVTRIFLVCGFAAITSSLLAHNYQKRTEHAPQDS